MSVSVWTTDQLAYLEENYPDASQTVKSISEAIGKGCGTVDEKARSMGLREKRQEDINRRKYNLNKTLWSLYSEGLKDNEIARAAGLSLYKVTKWRQGRGLIPNRKQLKQRAGSNVNLWGGVPMETALTPDQCVVMESFLQDLCRIDSIAKKKNLGVVSASAFMAIWRDWRGEDDYVST